MPPGPVVIVGIQRAVERIVERAIISALQHNAGRRRASGGQHNKHQRSASAGLVVGPTCTLLSAKQRPPWTGQELTSKEKPLVASTLSACQSVEPSISQAARGLSLSTSKTVGHQENRNLEHCVVQRPVHQLEQRPAARGGHRPQLGHRARLGAAAALIASNNTS
jgi:hypothetical protein